MTKSLFTNLSISELKELVKECVTEVAILQPHDLGSKSDEDLMTQRETAKFLRVSIPTIINWKKEGKIPYYQNGRTVFFKKSELLKALHKNHFINI